MKIPTPKDPVLADEKEAEARAWGDAERRAYLLTLDPRQRAVLSWPDYGDC